MKLNERIVLPRLCDAVEAALGLLELCQGEEEVEFMVSDFSDAFHSMGVMEAERMHQVVAGTRGDYRIYETVVFGGGGSPLVWGRGAAFLGRSGQSLFSAAEARLEIFVDDPWTAWRGTLEVRRTNMVTLLLWWSALGLGLSWKKIELGLEVRWIGADVYIKGKEFVGIAIPEKYCRELEKEASRMLGVRANPAREIRCLAGRASWAGGIVPCVASLLQPCWAALADAERNGDEQARSASRSSPGPPKRMRVRLLPAEVAIPTIRVAHALEWLVAFMRRQRGAIRKEFTVLQRRNPFGVCITTDASPWGYGGFVAIKGVVIGWFSEAVSAEDIQRFGIVVGEAKFQALLENLALLIAVRLWSHLWVSERLAVCLRSDSSAALGAWTKERSTNADINAIVREMSLDLAEGKYTVDRLEHLPGKLNEAADVLSRQAQPGNAGAIPQFVLDARKYFPAVRDRDWWQLAARPSQVIL